MAIRLHLLYKLLKKGSKFEWTEECEIAFVETKTELGSDGSSAHYDPGLPLRLVTDASNVGVGAVLIQEYPKNRFIMLQKS